MFENIRENVYKLEKLLPELEEMYNSFNDTEYEIDINKLSDEKEYLEEAAKLKNTKAMILLGEYYYNEKNYKEMKKYYKLAAYHGNLFGCVQLGNYYTTIDANNKAIKYYNIADNNKIALSGLSDIYYNRENHEKFLEICDKRISLNYYEVYFDLGLYYNRLENFEKMVECYELCITNNVMIDEVCIKMYEYYKKKENNEECIKYLKMLIDNKKYIYIYIKDLLDLYDENDRNEYIKELMKKDKDYIYTLGVYYKYENMYKEMIECYELSDSYSSLSIYYYNLGDIKKAEEYLKQCKKESLASYFINTDDIENIKKYCTHTNIGLYYQKKNDIRNTLIYFDLALSNKEYGVLPHLIKHYEHDYNKVIEYCKLDLTNVNFLVKLGDIYQYNGDYENMIKYYHLAIEQNSVKAMLNMARYIRKNTGYSPLDKDCIGGKTYYDMAIEKESSQAVLEVAQYYTDVSNYDFAEKYYKMGVEFNSSECIAKLGYFYMTQKRYEDMKIYLDIAVKKNNIYALHIYGMYYEKCEKNEDKMVEYYTKAIGNGYEPSLKNLETYYFKDQIKILNILFDKYSLDGYNNQILVNKITELLKNPVVSKYIDDKMNYYKNINNIHLSLYKDYVSKGVEICNGRKTDFIIKSANKTYYVHSMMLNSQYFDQLLNQNFGDNGVMTFTGSDKVLEELIKFLYTGEISRDLSTDTLEELLSVSRFYLLENLEELCKFLVKYEQF